MMTQVAQSPQQYVPSNLCDGADGEGRRSAGGLSGVTVGGGDSRLNVSPTSGVQQPASAVDTSYFMNVQNEKSVSSPGMFSMPEDQVSPGFGYNYGSRAADSVSQAAGYTQNGANNSAMIDNPKFTPLVYNETPRSDIWGPTPRLLPKRPSHPFVTSDNPLLIRPTTGAASSSYYQNIQQPLPTPPHANNSPADSSANRTNPNNSHAHATNAPPLYRSATTSTAPDPLPSWKTVPAASMTPFYPGEWVPNAHRPELRTDQIENPPIAVENTVVGSIVNYGPSYSMPYKPRCTVDKVPVTYTGFLALEGVQKEDDQCRVG